MTTLSTTHTKQPTYHVHFAADPPDVGIYGHECHYTRLEILQIEEWANFRRPSLELGLIDSQPSMDDRAFSVNDLEPLIPTSRSPKEAKIRKRVIHIVHKWMKKLSNEIEVVVFFGTTNSISSGQYNKASYTRGR